MTTIGQVFTAEDKLIFSAVFLVKRQKNNYFSIFFQKQQKLKKICRSHMHHRKRQNVKEIIPNF